LTPARSARPASSEFARRRSALSSSPFNLHEELDALVRYYHHLHNEIVRKGIQSSVRRRLEDRLLDVRERFGRLLDEWVPDEVLRAEWRDYLHNRVPEPSEPGAVEPLTFKGHTDAGSVVEVRGSGDEYEVWVDGSLQERVAAKKDLSVRSRTLHFRWDGKEIEETFDASQEALDALDDYLNTDGASPPWDYAAELLADGLIDRNFDLTPRGRRASEWVESLA
jgi:hypothetical protein